MRRTDLARTLLAVTYLLGAAVHWWLGATDPTLYERFADAAILPGYTDLWRAVVVPRLPLLQPLVIAFEACLGVALLWRGRLVRGAHVAGGLFQLALAPAGPWAPINLLLTASHAAGLRQSFPASIPTLVRGTE